MKHLLILAFVPNQQQQQQQQPQPQPRPLLNANQKGNACKTKTSSKKIAEKVKKTQQTLFTKKTKTWHHLHQDLHPT